jgi:hypothetical protein
MIAAFVFAFRYARDSDTLVNEAMSAGCNLIVSSIAPYQEDLVGRFGPWNILWKCSQSLFRN